MVKKIHLSSIIDKLSIDLIFLIFNFSLKKSTSERADLNTLLVRTPNK